MPGKLTGFIEPASFILHIGMKLKIKHYNMAETRLENDLPTNFNLNHIEKQSLADFTSHIFSLIIFGANLLLTLKVNGMSPKETNEFPNYIYVHLFQLVAPSLICFTIAVFWYLRHETMRREIMKEVKNKLQMRGILN